MSDRTEYDYRVVALHRVVDGDTFDMSLEDDQNPVDVGFGFTLPPPRVRLRFRLFGVDAWETNHAGGSAATRFALEWISYRFMAADRLRGVSYKHPSRVTPDGEFGRWLIDLYDDTGTHLADALVAAGHARYSTP
jgi:endonuclease YncB( thermonuclease family)